MPPKSKASTAKKSTSGSKKPASTRRPLKKWLILVLALILSPSLLWIAPFQVPLLGIEKLVLRVIAPQASQSLHYNKAYWRQGWIYLDQSFITLGGHAQGNVIQTHLLKVRLAWLPIYTARIRIDSICSPKVEWIIDSNSKILDHGLEINQDLEKISFWSDLKGILGSRWNFDEVILQSNPKEIWHFSHFHLAQLQKQKDGIGAQIDWTQAQIPRQIHLDQIKAKALLNSDGIKLEQITGTSFGSKLSGQASIEIKHPKVLINSDLKLDNLDLRQAANWVFDEGIYTGSANFNLKSTSNFSPFFAQAQGTGRVKAQNLLVESSPFQRNITARQMAPGFEKIFFDSLNIPFELKDGSILIQDASGSSKLADLQSSGQIGIFNRKLTLNNRLDLHQAGINSLTSMARLTVKNNHLQVNFSGSVDHPNISNMGELAHKAV